MGLLRVILIGLAGLFLVRIVIAAVRLLMNRHAAGTEEGTVKGREHGRPLEKPFRDARDATFEDLSGTTNQKVHEHPD
jgi:hypothetical protein